MRLHRHQHAAPQALSAKAQKRSPRPCPCCGLAGGFCASHRATLARVREQIADDAGKVRSVGNKRRTRAKEPTCVRVGCWEPRVPPAAFCPGCEAQGYREEYA